MKYEAKYYVESNIIERAKNLGLFFQVEQDNDAKNPRKTDVKITSTYVGGASGLGSDICDTHTSKPIDSSCMTTTVAHYLAEKGLNADEVLWWPVHFCKLANVALVTTPFNWRCDIGIVGFIFESKATICKEFGVKDISNELKNKIEGRINLELSVLAEWINKRVYKVGLLDKDGRVVASRAGVYEYDINSLSADAEGLIGEHVKASA